MEGYDPVSRSFRIKDIITRRKSGRELRCYYRFRADRWYGGIATGDVIGCNLSCKFCWSWYFKDRPDLGSFYTSEEAFNKIMSIMRRRDLRRARLSGGEPTLSIDHLLEILRLFDESSIEFILETNGILIGFDERLARALSRYSNIIVRVSFKGVSRNEFHMLTGANPESFELQFKALENLINSGLKPGREVYPAAMIGFSRDEDIIEFSRRLTQIHPALAEVDWEYVILYPHVKKILSRAGLKPVRAVDPSNIPREMI
ncbi:MAG: radical SAM protein [Sulfolobales archaeon]